MNIVNKKLNRNEFAEYVNSKDFGSVPPNMLVIHHTWRPQKEQWQGERSVLGLKRYYEGKGWNAAPHMFIAEDGIWLFTDMYNVGIHAGAWNSKWKKGGKVGTGYPPSGAKVLEYSIGIEVVGDYDERLWEGETKENTLHAIRTLKNKLGIADNMIKFHRDINPHKSCPGRAITKGWLFNELSGKEDIRPVEDQPSEWAAGAWKKAVEKGVFNGEKPQQPVTREQMALILERLKLI